MPDEEPAEKESGKFYQVMFKYYVPIITSPATRYLVVRIYSIELNLIYTIRCGIFLRSEQITTIVVNVIPNPKQSDMCPGADPGQAL